MGIVVRKVCEECGAEERDVATALPISLLGSGYISHTSECSGGPFIMQIYEGKDTDIPPTFLLKTIGGVL